MIPGIPLCKPLSPRGLVMGLQRMTPEPKGKAHACDTPKEMLALACLCGTAYADSLSIVRVAVV